jgi:hypothetical protein
LVDDPISKFGADEGKDPVSIFCPQSVAVPGSVQAVQPVHPIQTLDNAYTFPPQAPQIQKLACTADDQDRIARYACQVFANLNPAPAQARGKLLAKGDHTPHT